MRFRDVANKSAREVPVRGKRAAELQESSQSAPEWALVRRMQQPTEPTHVRKATAIALLALLGPATGAATQLWAQAVLVLGLGALLLIAPPRRSPGITWLTLFTLVAVLALTAFLPAHWFGIPEWRRLLVTEFPVELAPTVSPQPWLSFHSFCLLFAGLALALYMVAHSWTKSERHRAFRVYATGIAILAAVAIASTASGYKVPFWPKVLNSSLFFGFFPNRNQTANVLALAGIISTALAFDSFKRRRVVAWFWTAAVMAFSRAGILLFFGGIASWVLFSAGHTTSRKGAALGVAGLALALTGFFLFGGKTFERFQGGKEEPTADYRTYIQPDALKLSLTKPWIGQGLGNFQPVFAMARAISADENRALHPESDWLWAAVEMGWPAALLLASAFFLWLKQCLPFSEGSDRSLRSAAAVCGIAFALHAFVDVSGHRPGSAWPALFLAGFALHPGRRIEERRLVAPVFRLLGLVLVGIGAWWVATLRSDEIGRKAPTPGTVARLMEKMDAEIARGSRRSVFVTLDEILRIRPLDADIYFQRGVLRAAREKYWGALRDFQTARFLEPNWVELCRTEGKVWMSANQLAPAQDAWLEAMRRAGKKAPSLFEGLLYESRSHSAMRAILGEIAQANPEYLLLFLQQADRLECELKIGQLLDSDPKLESLSSEQRRRLFATWFQRGDRPMLISKLLAEPTWTGDGWPWLARAYADGKDFERAYATARKFGKSAKVPALAPNKSLADLERAFHFRPDDFQLGLEFFSAQRAAGQIAESLGTLAELQKIPGHPAYLAFLEADIRAERGEWEAAWTAWVRFAGPEFR
jgi:O-antigen ligase/tetratricopeptide (TPR) repeat protein